MYNIRFTDSGHSVEIGYLDRIDVMNIRYEGGYRASGGGRGRSKRTVVQRDRTARNRTLENIWPYVRAKMKTLGYIIITMDRFVEINNNNNNNRWKINSQKERYPLFYRAW